MAETPRRRKALFLTIPTLLLTAGLVFRHSLASSWPAASARPPIRIAAPDYLSFALVELAHTHGFFRNHRLNVELVPVDSGQAAFDLLLEGKADFAACAGAPVAYAALDSHDVLIITGLSTIDGEHTIVARRGAGIRSAFDLRGRTIAVPMRTSAEFFLKRYLEFHGVPTSAVRLVPAERDRLNGLLLARKVDAICTWKPWELPGNGFVRFGGDGIYTWNSFLVSRRSTIERNPEAVEKVLKALMDAESYAISHRQELAAELAPDYHMDVRDVETVSNGMRFGVTLDHAMLRSLEDVASWAANPRPGAPVNAPDFLGYFYFQGLSHLRPDAVTIVHNEDPEPRA